MSITNDAFWLFAVLEGFHCVQIEQGYMIVRAPLLFPIHHVVSLVGWVKFFPKPNPKPKCTQHARLFS